jgi:DNA-binding transcriptional ArsR family regulator
MEKRDLLIHPVRLRILSHLAGKQMTTAMLAAALPEIPQATLYRQIKILVDGGMLTVVGESEVRGAVERTYTLTKGSDRLTAQDLANLSGEDHLRYFGIFTATLLDAFGSYLEQADLAHLLEDGLAYNHVVLYLTESERESLRTALLSAVQGVMNHQPSAERRPYTLASVVIPGKQV